MRLNRCDNCGRETTNTVDWLTLTRPYDPPAPEGYAVFPGREEFDLCSPKCVEEKVKTFYTPESEGAPK